LASFQLFNSSDIQGAIHHFALSATYHSGGIRISLSSFLNESQSIKN